MDVLALIHGENVRPGIFADVVARRGGRLREWSLAWGPLPPGDVDALLVGGSMHPDEERRHPWLLEELRLLATTELPVLGALPARFEALQWHWYTHDLPAGAVELARSAVCLQAFRLGDRFGVQFHPEVTGAHVRAWAAEDGVAGLDEETARRLPRWQELGALLCEAFLDYAAGRSSRRDHSCHEPA